MKKILGIVLILLTFLSCTGNKSKVTPEESYSIVLLDGPSKIAFESLINGEVKAPVHLTHQIYDNPMKVQSLLLQNKPDIAVVPTTMAANLYNKGVDYVPLACVVWGNIYLVSSNDSIQTTSQLYDKEMYIFGKGLQPDLLAQIRFNPYHVRYNYKYDSHIALSNAVAAGIVDLAILPEPFTSRALQANPHVKIIDEVNFLHNGERIPQSLVMIKRSLLPYKQEIGDYIKAVLEASVLKNSEPATTVKRCNIEYKSIEECADQVHYYFSSIFGYNPKLIGDKFPDQDFYGTNQ
ncbi:MAG: hypothetical protein ACRCX4_06495 [Bacteroidales bacterium]